MRGDEGRHGEDGDSLGRAYLTGMEVNGFL